MPNSPIQAKAMKRSSIDAAIKSRQNSMPSEEEGMIQPPTTKKTRTLQPRRNAENRDSIPNTENSRFQNSPVVGKNGNLVQTPRGPAKRFEQDRNLLKTQQNPRRSQPGLVESPREEVESNTNTS